MNTSHSFQDVLQVVQLQRFTVHLPTELMFCTFNLTEPGCFHQSKPLLEYRSEDSRTLISRDCPRSSCIRIIMPQEGKPQLFSLSISNLELQDLQFPEHTKTNQGNTVQNQTTTLHSFSSTALPPTRLKQHLPKTPGNWLHQTNLLSSCCSVLHRGSLRALGNLSCTSLPGHL